jgi:hypothetical protein
VSFGGITNKRFLTLRMFPEPCASKGGLDEARFAY